MITEIILSMFVMISDPTIGDTGRFVRVNCFREHVCPRGHRSVLNWNNDLMDLHVIAKLISKGHDSLKFLVSLFCCDYRSHS